MPLLRAVLKEVRASVRRYAIEGAVVADDRPKVPLALLRGTFGAALHDLSADVYREVFRPGDGGGVPQFVLRRSPAEPGLQAFEFVLFGASSAQIGVLDEAWALAGRRGLGRRRQSVTIRPAGWVASDARCSADHLAFNLAEVVWPLSGDPATTPCRLTFEEPLRVLRAGALICQPTMRDVIVAACHRLGALSPPLRRGALHAVQHALLDEWRDPARAPFTGVEVQSTRWSAAQQRRVGLRAVTGSLSATRGVGSAWSLLAAARWMHLGKATTSGFGRIGIHPIS